MHDRIDPAVRKTAAATNVADWRRPPPSHRCQSKPRDEFVSPFGFVSKKKSLFQSRGFRRCVHTYHNDRERVKAFGKSNSLRDTFFGSQQFARLLRKLYLIQTWYGTNRAYFLSVNNRTGKIASRATDWSSVFKFYYCSKHENNDKSTRSKGNVCVR